MPHEFEEAKNQLVFLDILGKKESENDDFVFYIIILIGAKRAEKVGVQNENSRLI